MAKYMLQWKVDLARTPEDPKKKQQQWTLFEETVAQQLKAGQLTEWGQYAGENDGYCIVEGSEVDVQKLTNFWSPFVEFKVNVVLSIEQASEATKDMVT